MGSSVSLKIVLNFFLGSQQNLEGVADEPRRKVTVLGNPESQWKAQYLIFEKLREEGFSQGVEDVKLTVEIMVPSSQVWEFLLSGGWV